MTGTGTLFVFEEQYLTGLQEGKFALLDAVRKVMSPNGLPASMSIGIGMDTSLRGAAPVRLPGHEMALSRGGDQAVIKNRFNFEFYGGRARETERRTKVKSRVMANALGPHLQRLHRVHHGPQVHRPGLHRRRRRHRGRRPQERGAGADRHRVK